MTQRTLFDAGTKREAGDPYAEYQLARRTDPAQSHEAVPSPERLGDLQRETLEAIRANPGLTSTELARLHDYADPRVFNRRVSELSRKGLIRSRCVRPCSVTGKRAAAWEVTR